MAIDTPARIAVLGAGPVGLEAALYARFLGYDVDIYERSTVAGDVRRWGHVRMFTPFRDNRSTLGVAALKAQDEHYQPPADDSLLTGNEWVDQYLAPLANSDLLADHIHQQTTVVAVGRHESTETRDQESDGTERQPSFRLLLREAGGERIAAADVVMDASGVFGNAVGLGQSGAPAAGEMDLHDAIEYELPDLLGAQRTKYAGSHTLVVGDGWPAAITLIALAKLAEQEPDTRISWLMSSASAPIGPPAAGGRADPAPARSELLEAALELTRSGAPRIRLLEATHVASIARDGQFLVQFDNQTENAERFDNVVAAIGHRAEYSIVEELGVPQAIESPRAVEPLLPAVPHLYALGAKSYGRDQSFLISDGLQQIRSLFAIIGGRSNLDLYATAKGLPS